VHEDEFSLLVGFQMQMASLRLNEAARAALAGHGLSPAKVAALALIKNMPGCEQSALARALSINRASAMKLVNILVDRGLIERRRGRDLRSNSLWLTEEGAAGLAHMTTLLRASEDQALAMLTTEERNQLLKLLAKVHGDISKSRTPARRRSAAGDKQRF